jgi:hypothetical protein
MARLRLVIVPPPFTGFKMVTFSRLASLTRSGYEYEPTKIGTGTFERTRGVCIEMEPQNVCGDVRILQCGLRRIAATTAALKLSARDKKFQLK